MYIYIYIYVYIYIYIYMYIYIYISSIEFGIPHNELPVRGSTGYNVWT